jgi:4,5:9,10-diseco-3-hydroxy-5,9,17-trioxoandrosta-1(10),2-diene-4-oate hydrolase
LLSKFALPFIPGLVLGLILLLVYLNKVTLLGNSLGGAVALGYALAYPNEVGRLILMAPGGVEDLQTYLDMPGIANMFKIYQSGKTGSQAMRSVMSMQLFDPSLLTDEIIAERAPIAAIQTQAARSVMKIPNMTERLKELQCPIFGFWGVNDQFNPLGGP